jgi:RNA polymerase sigma-70 factor, ECF subfamily
LDILNWSGHSAAKALEGNGRELRVTQSLAERVTADFEQLRDPVYRYLLAAFGQPGQAEDIVQEAFLQLYRHLHSGKAVTNVRAWVFRVAHNLAINQIKSGQFLATLDGESALYQSRQDAALNPEEKVLRKEQFERLNRSLARLTAAERHCLHLRAKGLRYRDIAEITGTSTTTVAETLYRAIGKLAKESEWTT